MKVYCHAGWLLLVVLFSHRSLAFLPTRAGPAPFGLSRSHLSASIVPRSEGGSVGFPGGDDFKKLLDSLMKGGGMVSVDVLNDDGTVAFDDAGGGGGGEDAETKSAAGLAALRSFDLKPREVVEYLDRYVIQQKDAKKVLAVAVCDHYNHCRRCLDGEEGYETQAEYAKPNILLAGPTGVGKTYLMKCIARLIGVPFVKGDATKFSETGIVGRDAEDLVRDLVSAAGGNTTLAEYGIIYIDEVDKIAAGGGGGGPSLSRGDFNTRGVQNNFLKLLEDTDVQLQGNSPFEIMGMGGGGGGTVNTRNILFIFSGAFSGLDAEIRRKKEQKPFGIDLDGLDDDSSPTSGGGGTGEKGKKRSYLQYAETKDFVNAGLEPEFVGRVPVRVALNSLDADDLKQILVQAEGSVLKQFTRDLAGYGINMTTTDKALSRVAEFAEEEETGARGLVTILERTLRGHKYELPSTSIREFELDSKTVEEPGEALQSLLSTQTKEDELFVRLDDFKRWERYVNRQVDPRKIWMTDEAIDHMMNLSLSEDRSAYSLAREHFENLPDAVIRIGESTGQMQFPISLDLAKDPETEIATWLRLISPETEIASPPPETDVDAPPQAKKRKKSRRESDLDALLSPDAKAPAFSALLSKVLTFGAPGRFARVQALPGGMPMDEFDPKKARKMLQEEQKKSGLSDQDAAEAFACVVNCMIIDIIDLASSTLEEKNDKPTVEAMNVAMDFMDHSAGLFEPFLEEGVSIKPVTYGGTLGKGKLEQLYSTYANALIFTPGVTSERMDKLRELFEIKEERAEDLVQKKMTANFFKDPEVQQKAIEEMMGGEGMEDMMAAMGGMEGLAGMPGMDEEISPEQLKISMKMFEELIESGSVSKEEMKVLKEAFKTQYGMNVEELIANADSEVVKEQLGDDGKELLEMFKNILKAIE